MGVYYPFTDPDGFEFESTGISTVFTGTVNENESLTVSNGLVITGITTFNSNLTIASGSGIDFSATGNPPGMTSELFDDYEEGTWTPTLPNGGTINAVQGAYYTKIGRLVNIYLYINSFTPVFNSDQFRIGGLPYIAINGAYYPTGQIGYTGSIDWHQWRPLVANNNSYIYFHRTDGNAATATNNDLLPLSPLTILLLSISYNAA